MCPESSIPSRACRKCGRSLPSTAEFFRTYGSAGKLRSVCRACERHNASLRREKSRDRINANHRRWSKLNSDVVKGYRDAGRANDPERYRRYAREWGRRNREHCRAGRLNDLAHRVHGVPGSITKEDIADAISAQDGRCAYCMCSLDDGYTVDHVVPMSKGGPNTRGNIVAACKSCNCSKNDKSLEEWFGV